MSLKDVRHTEQHGAVTNRVRSARHGGIGYVTFERESLGATVTIGFRADDVEALCDAIRQAARDAAFSESDDIIRAQAMVGVARRGR